MRLHNQFKTPPPWPSLSTHVGMLHARCAAVRAPHHSAGCRSTIPVAKSRARPRRAPHVVRCNAANAHPPPLMAAVTSLMSNWGAWTVASSGSVDRLLLSSAISVASAVAFTRCMSACATWIDHRFEHRVKRLQTPSSLLSTMKMVFGSVAAPLAIYLPTVAALASLTRINVRVCCCC